MFNTLKRSQIFASLCRFFSVVKGEGWAYRVLGLSPTNTLEMKKLRDTYYHQAMLCHPDSAAEGEADAMRFSNLSEAYKIILDAKNGKETNRAFQRRSEPERNKWAKLFFGSVHDDIEMDSVTIRQLQETTQLSQGGLDKGGWWALADMAKQFITLPNESDGSLPTLAAEDVPQSQSTSSMRPSLRRKSRRPPN